jgi:hypothetical protein
MTTSMCGLTLISTVLYAFIIRDIARDLRGSEMDTLTGNAPDRIVCVWFGEHKIVEHVSDPAYAKRFEAAMRRRFASLRVTNEAVMVSDADVS